MQLQMAGHMSTRVILKSGSNMGNTSPIGECSNRHLSEDIGPAWLTKVLLVHLQAVLGADLTEKLQSLQDELVDRDARVRSHCSC